PLRAASVGPYRPTQGTPRAAARCSGPVSAATIALARRSTARSSSRLVGGARNAPDRAILAPPGAILAPPRVSVPTIARASARSVGPPPTTTHPLPPAPRP